jgi:hypothetical protein
MTEYVTLRRLEADSESIEKGQLPVEAIPTGRIVNGEAEYIYGCPELVAALVDHINKLKYYNR